MKQLIHLPSTITSTRVDAAVCVSQPRLLRMLGSLALLALLLAWSNVASAQSVARVSKGTSAASSLVFEVEGPQGASVSATPVVRTSPNGKRLYGAYDINVSKDGREWQPAPDQPALVTMAASNLVDGKFYDVYHEGKGGLEFVATVMPENGHITFPAHSFSVYIVAESGNYARLKVTFHRADDTEVTIYVKPADLDQGFFDRIVYNPGVGTVPSGMQCRGWIANASYTAANAYSGLSIVEVRNAIRTRLGSTVHDGDELHFYVMLFKSYTVSYLDENGVVLATSDIPFLENGAPAMSYTVNASYTPPDNSQKFEGWKVREGGSNISGHTANRLYTNGTGITIRGDVVFYDTISEGHWLIYHENGKGATYKAADFVNAGAVTVNPTPPLSMMRNGYTFDGWWTGAPATEGGIPGGVRFIFGNELDDNTHIYAKWTPRTNADYTIIVWKQNVEGDGFDFDTAITLNGTVGQNINVNSTGTGDGRYAIINGRNYRETQIAGHDYTGFHLDSISQMVTVNTEGNAVRNVYYGRNQHTLRFQIYDYIYTVTTSNNGTQYGIVDGEYVQLTRHGNGNNRYWTYNDGWFSEGPRYNGTRYTRSEGWQDIKVITALYGQPIGENFPIVGSNGVTYNQGQRWDPQSTATANDVIVYIDVMPDKDETYHLNVADRQLKTINYYVEALPGTAGTIAGPGTLYDYNNNTVSGAGIQFVLHRTIGASYAWVTKEEDFFNMIGYDRLGVNQAEVSINNGNDHGYCYNNPDATCTVSFYYTRKKYSITYMDGAYYDGRGNRLTSETSRGRLHRVENIAYRADISDRGDYRPVTTPEGYVFEGWYADATCNNRYTFDKMPEGGVTVFAKWRQIEYRVFLHPNAGTDPSLDWGGDDQEMNFRVAYGNRISAPTGRREDYEFAGWFTDVACTQSFNADAVVLNESNPNLATYDKSTDFTDPMDKWGNGATTNNDVDRFWITKKYELYGKWRAKLRGADGITVKFDCNGGSTSSTATYQYQDNVHAVAKDACTPPSATKEFSHWVLQNYNGSGYEDVTDSRIYPGAPFTVLKANAEVTNARWCAPGSESDCEPTEPGSTTPPAGHPTYTDYRADYTVKLRAEYLDIESPSYTFIIWYKNDGNGTVVRTDGTGRANPSLGINVTDPPSPSIPVAPTRAGYTFKGWYKKNISGSTIPDTVKQCTPNFLYYNNDNSKYYKEAGFTNEVTKVAADLYTPDDYLYAIWEPVVDFTIPGICRGQHITLPSRVDLPGSWSANSVPVDGTDYILESGAVSSVTFTFTPDPSSYPSSCASAKDITVTVNQLDAEIIILDNL